MFGVKIDEWAVWEESLNVDLVAYWNFDNLVSDVFEDVVTGVFNVSCSGTCANVTGILGQAVNITVSGTEPFSSANASDLGGNGGDTISVNCWAFKYGNVEYASMITVNGSSGLNADRWIFFTGRESNLPYWDAGTSGFDPFDNSMATNEWVMLTTVVDGGNESFYQNGEANGTDTGASWGPTDGQVAFGLVVGGNIFDGLIDECGVWNRTLSAEEVSDLYNGGTGITYTNAFSNYTITFNLTDGDTGEQLDLSKPIDDYALSCDNGFNVTEIDDNPYTATDFGNGVVECTFSDLTADPFSYFDETFNITADSNKTVEISMSQIGGLTVEEHDWLEAVHNCLINGVGCA